jgi:hypothetical protein
LPDPGLRLGAELLRRIAAGFGSRNGSRASINRNLSLFHRFPDTGQRQSYEAARQPLIPNLSRNSDRYQI